VGEGAKMLETLSVISIALFVIFLITDAITNKDHIQEKMDDYLDDLRGK